MMSALEFRRLIQRMRNSQKVYFIDRTREHLVEAKDLERQVDRVLESFGATTPADLFADTPAANEQPIPTAPHHPFREGE